MDQVSQIFTLRVWCWHGHILDFSILVEFSGTDDLRGRPGIRASQSDIVRSLGVHLLLHVGLTLARKTKRIERMSEWPASKEVDNRQRLEEMDTWDKVPQLSATHTFTWNAGQDLVRPP
jgi:hypothetical protein